ncbi:hypothetical protein PCE1_004020 [Barthelona sp. PCE]
MNHEHDQALTHLKDEQALRFREFQRKWKQIFASIQDDAEEHRAQLIAKHENERQCVLEAFEFESQNKTVKFSSELINYRRVEGVLAKQEKFAEAAEIKKKADDLQALEEERYLINRENALKNRMKHLIKRQKVEYSALDQRLFKKRQEREKTRLVELNQLKLQISNEKHQLRQKQSLEITAQKRAKSPQRVGSPNSSRRRSPGRNTRSPYATPKK